MLLRAFALAASVFTGARSPATVDYTLTLRPERGSVAEVAVTVRGAPASFRLAMKVHAEYDAAYWRYVDSVRVDGRGSVAREDSTLWRVTLPGGEGTIRYLVRIQPPPERIRVWQPYARADGAMINPPDFFLYIPELVSAPVTVTFDVPASWRRATAMPQRTNITQLLDSPIMFGPLHEWSFAEGGTTWHIVYWPRPDAAPFDTAAFVDATHRLVRSTLDIFGSAPSREF